jgi:hypothetical protein
VFTGASHWSLSWTRYIFSTWQSTSTHPQWGENILELAVAWAMDHLRGSNSWPLQSPDLTSFDFILWGFVKDDISFLPMPITLDNLKDQIQIKTAKAISLYCKMFHRKSNIFLMCARQQIKHIMNLHQIQKTILSCLLQWCSFNFLWLYFLTNKFI